MKRFLLICAVCALVLGAGCKRQAADDQAAIRTALQSYLSQRGNLNMAGMDMDVQVVRNDGKTADANVTFRAKQGGGAMQMAYQLERQGNLWVVKGSRSASGAAHPAVGESAPAGAAPGAGGGMPTAHPPITAPQATPPPPAAPPKRP